MGRREERERTTGCRFRVAPFSYFSAAARAHTHFGIRIDWSKPVKSRSFSGPKNNFAPTGNDFIRIRMSGGTTGDGTAPGRTESRNVPATRNAAADRRPAAAHRPGSARPRPRAAVVPRATYPDDRRRRAGHKYAGPPGPGVFAGANTPRSKHRPGPDDSGGAPSVRPAAAPNTDSAGGAPGGSRSDSSAW